MTIEKLIEFEKYSEQLEIELHQKRLTWLKAHSDNKKDETEKPSTPYIPPVPSNTNINKELHEVQTGVIKSFEKDSKQLKVHFELENGDKQTQCYQFTKEGVYYLLNNFLEPMQVTNLDKSNSVKDFVNFNYNAFSGVIVEIERSKQNQSDRYWSLDKCTPVIEPLDW